MGRIIFLLLLGTAVFTLPCAVTAASLPISIPMDHQINIGLGNAITGPGALSFQAANPGADDGKPPEHRLSKNRREPLETDAGQDYHLAACIEIFQDFF